MASGEMEKVIEFLLTHQAGFERRLDKLAESQTRLTDAMRRMVDFVADLQKKTDERFRQTDERFKQTDKRLNALISVVERHITGHDHGGARPQ